MKYANHARKRRKFENRIFNILFAFIALAGILSLCGVFGQDNTGISLAALPLMGIRPLLSPEPDNNGGGGAPNITEHEFRAKVLTSVEAVRKQHETIDKNFLELDKEAKALSANFSTHVKAFAGLPDQIQTMERTMAQIQLKQANERRSNFGSAIERISNNPEMRQLVNDMLRSGANCGGRNAYPISKSYTKVAEDFRRTGLLEASGAGAGYIHTELVKEIYSLIAEYGIWSKFDVIPLSQNAANMIVDTTDPTMAWTAEATASSETNYAGGNVALAVGKLLGWMSVPNELLEDAVVDIGRYVLPKFANATAKALDWACTSADGTADATDGGFTGIFGGGGTAAVAASGNITMATLDLDDWIAAMAAVGSAALSRPCYWWIHPTNLIKALLVKDSNGRSIFLPATDAPAFGAIGSILGYPVILTHSAPSTNTVDNKVAVFGDPMGLGVGLRSDFTFASSDHILFKEDSTVFRARARAAVKVKLATAFGVLTLAAS